MSPEQWTRFDDLYDRASALPPERRAAFIEASCDDDSELAAELVSLLEIKPRSDSFMATPLLDVAALTSAQTDPMLGRRIAAYLIEARLGAGGMGVVYRARQDSPARTVALKLLRPGITSPSIIRRFHHEAEALGRLQHPGIAQIFESGRAHTPQGLQPFFAMELVDGRPLLDYARERDLTTRQRLDLMARICDAVQYAHLKGIIHRDLKPGNILVDHLGQPKVLDFGIARLTDSDIRVTTIQTDIGQLIGTVPYMSPEQAAGDPNELDTRSDVYALGVVLFELLSGRLPYELRNRPVTEAVRVIAEQDHTKLSSISRGFRGDIETIVAKALEKDKARRYQSASDLAADLRRFLADQTIVARPATTLYQLHKFARRHKTLVGGVLTAVILLIAGVIGTSIGLARALSSERLARAETIKARTEASKARHAVTFVQDMLAAANPDVSEGRSLTVHDVLDEAAARVETELKDEPAVRAAVQETLGRAYLATGDLDKAADRLAKSLDDYQAVGGLESVDVARGFGHLATLKAARGDRKGALEEAKRSLALFERLGIEQEVASAKVDVGMYHYQLNEYEPAERYLSEAITAYERLIGRRTRPTANALDILGQVWMSKGDFDASVLALRESADIKREVAGDSSPALAFSLNNLASAVRNQGRADEAEAYVRESLEIRRRVYGSEHAQVAAALVTQAGILIELDRYDQAEKSLVEALQTRRKILEPGHIDIAQSLQALARLNSLLCRYDDAIPQFQEALDIRRTRLGEHRLTAQTLEDMGAAYVHSGDSARGEPLAREALALRRKLLGPTSPMVARTLAIVANSRAEQKDYAGADALYRECMDILDTRKIAPSHPTRISFTIDHAAVLHRLGHDQEAGAMLRTAIESLRAPATAQSTDLARALDRFADLLSDSGDPRGAEAALAEALTILEARLGSDNALTAKTRAKLGQLRLAAPAPGPAPEPSTSPYGPSK